MGPLSVQCAGWSQNQNDSPVDKTKACAPGSPRRQPAGPVKSNPTFYELQLLALPLSLALASISLLQSGTCSHIFPELEHVPAAPKESQPDLIGVGGG